MILNKKVAMFGLDLRALRKQFGELFLARRQSKAPFGANGSSRYTKRAAMFGLDARIALTIFAILSIVGSYVIYDRTTEAQEDSFLQQVIALRQAAMQNIADNGDIIAIDDTNINVDIFGLEQDYSSTNLQRGKNNYSYVNINTPSATAGVMTIVTPERNITLTTDNVYASTAATGASYTAIDCANTSATCYYWFRLLNVSEKYFNILDEYFDGTTGGFTDTNSTQDGIITALAINTSTDTATVLVQIHTR